MRALTGCRRSMGEDLAYQQMMTMWETTGATGKHGHSTLHISRNSMMLISGRDKFSPVDCVYLRNDKRISCQAVMDRTFLNCWDGNERHYSGDQTTKFHYLGLCIT
ncbi:hypothetical protein M413DRAFT_150525 [Hebeloma cylindrosporum]|uniref:Uncharacterized protein n=1 Tax=Hebeloma cylindrosporum TaxID=76867 RepID=A0A0C2YKH1_HEBCY|nr:hypothetical protein M413DRAFT_150525 [Hebeloma cylindrosporum h7]